MAAAIKSAAPSISTSSKLVREKMLRGAVLVAQHDAERDPLALLGPLDRLVQRGDRACPAPGEGIRFADAVLD
jgi:hypothetical protein